MHPDMMLELLNQRAAEAMDRAREARLAQTARTARKLTRRQRGLSRTLTAPEIPDYVDMMFTENGRQAPERRAA